MRAKIAIAVTVGLATIGLSACSTTALIAPNGASTMTVDVKGTLDSEPKVEFPTPLQPKAMQCRAVIPGTGEAMQAGQTAQARYTFYSGATGQKIQSGGYPGDAQGMIMLYRTSNDLTGMDGALSCARSNSRVVATIPADTVGDPTQLGLNKPQSVVIVLDVDKVYPARANGVPQITRDGFPAVVLAPDGTPGITVPKTVPPKSTQTELLRAGSGATLKAGDVVVVNYSMAIWNTGAIALSTWGSNSIALKLGADGSLKGIDHALIGQRVGSQVGLIATPEDAFGEQGNPDGSVPPNSTTFWVIDVLSKL